jgi:hypothetical protein
MKRGLLKLIDVEKDEAFMRPRWNSASSADDACQRAYTYSAQARPVLPMAGKLRRNKTASTANMMMLIRPLARHRPALAHFPPPYVAEAPCRARLRRPSVARQSGSALSHPDCRRAPQPQSPETTQKRHREAHLPAETWQLVFSVIDAIAVGITAFVRVTAMTAPGPGQGTTTA